MCQHYIRWIVPLFLCVLQGCQQGGDTSSDTITSPSEAPAAMTGTAFQPVEGQAIFKVVESGIDESGALIEIGFNVTDPGDNDRAFGLRSQLSFGSDHLNDFLQGAALRTENLREPRMVVGAIGGEQWVFVASRVTFESDGRNARIRLEYDDRRALTGEVIEDAEGWLEISGTIAAICMSSTEVDSSFTTTGFCADFVEEHPELLSVGLLQR